MYIYTFLFKEVVYSRPSNVNADGKQAESDGNDKD